MDSQEFLRNLTMRCIQTTQQAVHPPHTPQTLTRRQHIHSSGWLFKVHLQRNQPLTSRPQTPTSAQLLDYSKLPPEGVVYGLDRNPPYPNPSITPSSARSPMPAINIARPPCHPFSSVDRVLITRWTRKCPGLTRHLTVFVIHNRKDRSNSPS